MTAEENSQKKGDATRRVCPRRILPGRFLENQGFQSEKIAKIAENALQLRKSG